MATEEVVKSIFGPTPLEIEQAERQRVQGLYSSYGQMGGREGIGGVFGVAAGQLIGSLLGLEDPQLTRATKMKTILNTVTDRLSPADMANPTKFFPVIIDELSTAGFGDEATQMSLVAADEIGKWNKRQAEINKINKEAEEAGKTKPTKTKLQQAEEWLNTLVAKKAALEKEGASQESIDRIDEQISNAQAAIKLLTTQKQSTDSLLAEAINVLNNPQNHTKEEIEKAQQTYKRIFPIKSGQGELQGEINSDTGQIELTPIKGSETYNEKLEGFDKIINSFEIRTNKVAPTIQLLDDVLTKIDDPNSGLNFGPIGKGKSKIWGTAEYNLEQNELKTILANIGFKELQEMRDLSKTGGALGQVAVKEIEFLQATLGALNVGLPKNEFKKNVQRVKASYAKLIDTWNKMIAQAKIDKKKLVGETSSEVKEASSPSSSLDLLMEELDKRQPTSPNEE